jgi:hypothetical protein
VEEMRRLTGGGVDVVFDGIGGSHIDRRAKHPSPAPGRLCCLATWGGAGTAWVSQQGAPDPVNAPSTPPALVSAPAVDALAAAGLINPGEWRVAPVRGEEPHRPPEPAGPADVTPPCRSRHGRQGTGP